MSLAFTTPQPSARIKPTPRPPLPALVAPTQGAAAGSAPKPGCPATRPVELLGLGQLDALRDRLGQDSGSFERDDPEPSRALRRFGLVAWESGRLAEAVEAFTAALSLSPGHAPLWRDLAFVFQALDRPGEALTAIRRALDLEPGEAPSWLMAANLLNQQGDDEGAESAFRRAIACDSDMADAHFGLSLLLFGRRQYDEAARCLTNTLARVPNHAMAALCLGQVLYVGGDFPGSVDAFALAARLAPLPDLARRNFVRARAFATMLSGRVEEAVADHPALAGEGGEDVASLLYLAFSLFSASGHRAAAIAVGRFRLAQAPDDPVQRYLLDALRGRPFDAAPISYIEHHFDAFAPTFDAQLVNVLQYRVPEQLAGLAARHRRTFADIVDVGCGTGLAAMPLSAFAGRITGVDIAKGMLAEAAKRGLYADLVKAEAKAFLDGAPARFDLVFAADMLIYIGNLGPIFAAAAVALRSGGLFCLSIEARDEGTILMPSGRFAHAPAYVRSLAAADFTILDDVEQDLRLEGRAPVRGRLMVLERRG